MFSFSGCSRSNKFLLARPEIGRHSFVCTVRTSSPAGHFGIEKLIQNCILRFEASLLLKLRDIELSDDGDGTESPFTCADTAEIVASRANAFVPGNIFLSPAANGCGFSRGIEDGDPVLIWTGGNERVLGSGAVELSAAATGVAGGVLTITPDADSVGYKVLMAVGTGPSSNLFDASELGGMTSVPVYRHVGNTEYNRYFALFEIGEIADVSGTPTLIAADQVIIAGVVDGAGDTKEEELGEWDGTRNTI